MTDNGVSVFFVLSQEVVGSRKCYLIDVFINFFGSKTDTSIRDSDGTVFLISFYADSQIAQFALEIALCSQCFQLLSCIYCIRNQFAEEYLMIAI